MTAVRVPVRQFLYCAMTSGMLIGCLPWAQLSAQVVGATVSGTVVDVSGGATPNVRISIKNLATGIISNAQTNGVGFYIAPNLPAGNYELRTTAAGFATQVHSGISLTVGQELLLNLTLKVGSVSQTMTVSGEAPSVDLANATLGGVTDARTIEEIPLN